MSAGLRRLSWPLIAIAALLLVDLFFGHAFFALRMQDGHLYGNLVDILRFGAPPMLVALGMTIVIATGGIDLSVGALVAISGATACVLISDLSNQNSVAGVLGAITVGARADDGPRGVERDARRRRRHPADRRDPHPDGRRARDRAADHGGSDRHDQQLPVQR